MVGLLAGDEAGAVGLGGGELEEVLAAEFEGGFHRFGAWRAVSAASVRSCMKRRGDVEIPELTMKAFDICPFVESIRCCARASPLLLPKNREWQYETSSIWAAMAFFTRSFPWPRHATAAPPVASRMRCPLSRVR